MTSGSTAWPVPPVDVEAAERAAAVLRRGGLVAFPTETVYGLGADASDPVAVGRIFTAKGRPPGHPLIVHLADRSHLEDWSRDLSPSARRLADALWPGPLTLVVARSARVPDEVTGGRDTVGLRVPGHPWASALLDAFGSGVAAPSANRFGSVSPTTARHVLDDLGDAVDLVLDGGPCPLGVESTIVDCTGEVPEILRPGGVTAERLAEVLGSAPGRWSGAGPARAPGMLAAHYSPRARVVPVEGPRHVEAAVAALDGAGRVGVLAPASLPPPVVAALDGLVGDWIELEPVGDPDGFARQLYRRLHQADRLGLDVLVVVQPPDEGIGVAVRDRLGRAAAGA